MTKKKKTEEEQEIKEERSFDAELIGERVITEESDEARELYDQNRYGEQLEKKLCH